MRLRTISYSQYDGTLQEWKLEECSLGSINLVVGENASGKTKLLNLIASLGSLWAGERPVFLSANYAARFEHNGKDVDYALRCSREGISVEHLDIDGKRLLTRGPDGQGRIYYEQMGQELDFQAPRDQVVSVARRDALQHSFLVDLFEWGRHARHYQFGTDLGKNSLLVRQKAQSPKQETVINPKDTTTAVAMLLKGQREYGDTLTRSILDDMEAIGYKLSDVGVAPLHSIEFQGLPIDTVAIYVRESDLTGVTDQYEMSQGMFRALSLLIQITYSEFAAPPSCILIDDIGEGLDYNRSSALVRLLVQKAQRMGTQLIMATNDRFVMNNVPLEYWSIIRRLRNVSRIYNQSNSPKLFEDFSSTGLSNFDFFSSRYYLKDDGQS